MFIVGKIVGTHGIKGEVKVKRITDFVERFDKGNILYIQEDQEEISLTIDGFRTHKNMDILHFEGLNSINDVEPFKGATLKIKKEQLTELDEHEYYYHEIIGCTMYTTAGDRLGVIESILSPGANDVWVVQSSNGKELLIPYIEDVVKKIDVDNKQVTIELMEGLID